VLYSRFPALAPAVPILQLSPSTIVLAARSCVQLKGTGTAGAGEGVFGAQGTVIGIRHRIERERQTEEEHKRTPDHWGERHPAT